MLILHLSDIHFRKMEVETAQDPNFHLRNELLRDIKDQCEKLGSAPDVIIISGDIAFAGHPDEFVFATRWLKDLCAEIGAELESVFVCPGNHDAVRSKADAPLARDPTGTVEAAWGVDELLLSWIRDRTRTAWPTAKLPTLTDQFDRLALNRMTSR